jgi:hypothetical protein
MSDTQDYDGKNFDVLRNDLKELRDRAREEGVITGKLPAEKPKIGAGGGAARRFVGIQRESDENGERGKQLATRILTMLRRGADDTSPGIPGTHFTENGVRRLMAQLAEPPKGRRASAQLGQKLYKFLSAPTGGPMIAGASVERVKVLGNLLPQVEKHGWEEVRSHLAKRKENRAAEEEEPVAAPPPAAAKKTQRRGARRAAP